MIQSILPLLTRAIPAGVAVKKLMKTDSRMSNFIQGGLAAGYGADQLLEYLRNKTQTTGQKSDVAALERGAAAGTLRPGEQARLSKIQERQALTGAIPGAAALAGGIAGAVAPSAAPSEADGAKPTAKDVVKEISERKVDPSTAYDAFAKAGYSRSLDFLANKASGKVAFESLKRFTGPEFLEMLSERFGVPQEQIVDLALQHALQLKEPAAQAEPSPEAAAQVQEPVQPGAADQELMAAIQNLRSLMQG